MPYAETNGFNTYFETVGLGPPLLLISGNGMDRSAFDEQLPEFSRHFKCITYDLRGIGKTDASDPGYSIHDLAIDACELLAEIGIRKAHVAGYSLGGAIALEMAINFPDTISSLSLYSTYDRVEPYLRLRYHLLIEILSSANPRVWAMYSALTAFGERYINANEREVWREIENRIERWRGFNPPDPRMLEGHYRAVLSHDVSDRLHEISCPTFIAVGSSDPVMPPSYSARLHAKIPNSIFEIFEGKPHRLLNFGAERFTEAALRFLKEQT